LHSSAFEGYLDIVMYLVENGADVNSKQVDIKNLPTLPLLCILHH